MTDRRQGDRRTHRRYAGDWTGVWDNEHYVEEVRVTDLSMGGCKIQHSGNILQGQRGYFRLTPYTWIEVEVVLHDVMMQERLSSLIFKEVTKESGIEKLLEEVADE